jgi:Tol biopolymer transport system component
LTYTVKKDGAWQLVQTPSDGTGATEELVSGSAIFITADSWSRDGRSLLYSTPSESTAWDEWLLSLEDGSSRILAASSGYDSEGYFSPDGKWVVYHSAESGTGELYVQSLENGTRHQVSDRGGRDAIWTDNGEIIFRSGRRIMSVAVQTEPDFHASAPQVLFEGPFELETGGYRDSLELLSFRSARPSAPCSSRKANRPTQKIKGCAQ